MSTWGRGPRLNGDCPFRALISIYMATQKRLKTKTNRGRRLTLKDALRKVRKEHPGLPWNTQHRIAQRKVTLDELAIHVERYREEHMTCLPVSISPSFPY
jgi:hypothetical protein